MVEEQDNKNYWIYFIVIGSILVSCFLLYKTFSKKDIYKFGFLTIENKPKFTFKDKINLFIVYNNTKNDDVLTSEAVKLWIYLLYNFKEPVYYSIDKECIIVYKNATSKNTTRKSCLESLKNKEYSVIVYMNNETKNKIIINNKKKQIIVYLDKENKEKIRDTFIFLKDLILGQFKFD